MEPPGDSAAGAVDAPSRSPAPSPFARLRVRDLVALFLLFAFALVAILTVITSRTNRVADVRLLAVLLTATMVLPVLVRAHQTRLSWRRVFGPPLQPRDLPLTVAVVPVALFTLASALLIYVPLSYVAPDFVKRMLLSDTVFDAHTIGQWLLLALGGVAMAPIIEEVVFRGIILQRWAHRWGTRTGVIASSALFALGHGEWVGHFLFGLLMALLYLRTKRLWVPIAAHGLNNLLVTLPSLWHIVARAPDDPAETLASFRAGAWMGVPALFVGLLLGWIYMRLLWPPGSVRAALAGAIPYESR
jgi:membrane protease YdiL (CAAX protease family)